ncbi:MAG: YwmB family TATA-box binding protein [Clostridia bacterium]|nr:YwmB family TATA-box binding protein [Clostridia bacterium]
MVWTLKSFCLRLFAVCVAVAVVGVLFLCRFSALQSDLAGCLEGRGADSSSYFIHSPTCFAREKEQLSLFDLPFIQGEKVVYLLKKGETGTAETILAAFDAYDVWTEEIDGTTSYYAASEKLPKKVTVGGRTVNLHIAVKADRVVVGTPIIFGGY